MPPLPETAPAAEPLTGSLAQLEQIASATDAELAGTLPGAPVPEPPEPTLQQRGEEVAAMLGALVAMAAPLLPFLPECYTPDTCHRIGTAFAAVAEKHGWDLDLANRPELALAVVTIPPTIQAVVMGRAHFAHRKAQREPGPPGAPPGGPPRQPLRAVNPDSPPGPFAGERIQPSAV